MYGCVLIWEPKIECRQWDKGDDECANKNELEIRNANILCTYDMRKYVSLLWFKFT